MLIASVAFATSSPLGRLARPAPPLLIACARVAVAALILAALDPRGLLSSWRSMVPRDRARVALAGALLAGHFWLFQWGLDLTSLPAAAALISLEPMSVVLSAWALLGLAPRRLEIVSVTLGMAGALLVAGGTGAGEHQLEGDLLVLGAVVLFGLYVCSARALRDALPARHYAPLVYGMAALALGVVAAISPAPFLAEELPSRSWLAILALAILPTVVGHTLLQRAARSLSPSLVALACPGETLGSVGLGLVLFGAWPSPREALGGAVIVAAALLAIFAQRTATRGP